MHRQFRNPLRQKPPFYASNKQATLLRPASGGRLAEEPAPALPAPVLLRLQRLRRRLESVVRVLLLLGAGARRGRPTATERLRDARAAEQEPAADGTARGAGAGEPARRARLGKLEALLDGRELRLEAATHTRN
jgi:hypothetical protein